MKDIVWTSSETAKAIGGKAAGDWQASGVSIDSRTLEPGDLFVALKDVSDGHAYVAAALKKGAAAALVSQIPHDVDAARCLVVADTTQALVALGKARRKELKATTIGLTGSVGKTSTKEMLALALLNVAVAHAGPWRRLARLS